MRELRPLSETKRLVPGAITLEAWLEQNKAKYAALFG
jgi:hypothetical protein